jgi:hypothetical protein
MPSTFRNVFNHPNMQFAKWTAEFNTTTFGTAEFGFFLTAARDPHQIQFALKLSF